MGNITGKPAIGTTQVTDAGTTSNDADEAVDLYISNDISVAVDNTNAATITDADPTYNWTRNGLFKLVDGAPVPTAAITITVPAVKRARVTFKNETSFPATITISGQGETPDVVAAGTSAVFASDGTNIRIAGSQGTTEFTGLTDTPGSITADKPVVGNGAGTALVFGEFPTSGAGDALPFVLSPTARGAIIMKTSDAAAVDLNPAAKIAFDRTVYDTDSFFNNANDSLDIPAGVTKVRLVAQISTTFADVTTEVFAGIQKNGSGAWDGNARQRNLNDSTVGNTSNINISTPVIDVVPGDQFTLLAQMQGDDSVTVDAQHTFLAVEVVETTDTVPSLRSVVTSLPARWRGAMVGIASDDSATNFRGGLVKLPLDTAFRDTDSIFDNANDRLTVPTGVNKVELRASIQIAAYAGDDTRIEIHKNGSSTYDGAAFHGDDFGAGRVEVATTYKAIAMTGTLDVAEGDYFEVFIFTGADAATTIRANGTYFQMDIVEFNSSTDAVQAYIAVSPEHKGVKLISTGSQSCADTAVTPLAFWTSVQNGGNSFDPGDGGPAQRFWLGLDKTFVDGDVSVANDEITETAHGYQTGEGPLTLTSSGTLPAGLALATKYWIIRVDADTLKFATSRANALAGTDVDITAAAGGGTHTIETAEKLVVPAGVSKMRFSGATRVAQPTTNLFVLANWREGTALTAVSGQVVPEELEDNVSRLYSTTGILDIAEGEFYVLAVVQDSSGAINAETTSGTFIECEVIEESRAITYPGVTVTPPFQGCELDLTADLTAINATGGYSVPFNSEISDTDGFHDTVTNNDRITIPTGLGIRRCEFYASVRVEAISDASRVFLQVRKNGAAPVDMPAQTTEHTFDGVFLSVASGPYSVSDGDYFTVQLAVETDTSVTVKTNQTVFRMRVIETDENAFPPEPIEHWENGAPATTGVLFRKIANRRFTVANALAGSVARFETAPSGGTVDLDVDRNGTKIGTISWADGSNTATFSTLAAQEYVFDIGDRLTIDADSVYNSAADLIISLWGWRS